MGMMDSRNRQLDDHTVTVTVTDVPQRFPTITTTTTPVAAAANSYHTRPPSSQPQCPFQPAGHPGDGYSRSHCHHYHSAFVRSWHLVTSSANTTRYGFRRFRTAHLLNLRFLEEEIGILEERLVRKGARCVDVMTGAVGKEKEEIVKWDDVRKLRELVREYDSAILSLNTLLNMETFALADNSTLSGRRGDDTTDSETFQTQLIRIDIPYGGFRDPLREKIARWLRRIWHRRVTKIEIPEPVTFSHSSTPVSDQGPFGPSHKRFCRQRKDTIYLTDIIARFLMALLACVLLIVPLTILSFQQRRGLHLVTISVAIIAFSLLVSLASRASNQETLAAVAGYAAVLAVFIGSMRES